MACQIPIAFDTVAPTIQERFELFHARHPEVYRELRWMALGLHLRGHNRYSVDALWHAIRFALDSDSQVQLRHVRTDVTYRWNNNYTSRYARLLAADPVVGHMFKTRKLRAL